VEVSIRAAAFDERPTRTSRHRDLSGTGRVQDLAGVDHHLLDAGVARHTTDTDNVDIGVPDREQQREGIVGTGVHIHHDPLRHAEHASRRSWPLLRVAVQYGWALPDRREESQHRLVDLLVLLDQRTLGISHSAARRAPASAVAH
jgi:hypothetical protein